MDQAEFSLSTGFRASSGHTNNENRFYVNEGAPGAHVIFRKSRLKLNFCAIPAILLIA